MAILDGIGKHGSPKSEARPGDVVFLPITPGFAVASDEVLRMDILAVIIVLLALLFASTWSLARSYFQKGRLAGMEQGALEMVRGIRCHYERAGHAAPVPVLKAIETVRSPLAGASPQTNIGRFQSRLWTFGDAVGSACWRTGYDACKARMMPAPDRIRVDLSPAELLHLVALAHLGFKKMMPNDREVELHRFDDEQHALEVTAALERLEQAIPEPARPGQHADDRRALIYNWWPPERQRAGARAGHW